MTVNKDIMKSYRFKILPTTEQKESFAQWFGCRRFVYNYFASLQMERYKNGENYLSTYSLNNNLPSLKKEYPFLKDVNAQAFQTISKDVTRAVDTFFRKAKSGKGSNVFNFKKKYDTKHSISFPIDKTKNKKTGKTSFTTRFIHNYKVDKKARICYMQIPKMKTPLKILKHRNIEGKIKNVTLSRESDCYYISIQTQQSISLDKRNAPTSSIGIDLGIKKLVTTSNGEVFKPLNSFKTNKSKLAKLQRKLSRCVKKSNNFYRLKKKINKLHKKIAQIRKDYLHKISTYLVNNHAMIFIENLKISNMSKSSKGTIEKPGKKVSQKSGLNRSILDQGWGMFGDMLKYKQDWKDQIFEKQVAAYSSQECCHCHCKHKDNRVSQSKFVCISCDNKRNADLNASLIILYRGLLKTGLTKYEAQEIINDKKVKKISYTNLWIQGGERKPNRLFSGSKVAIAI